MIEVYELIVDEETAGVYAISLVENPAVNYNFLTFSSEKTMLFEVENVDKREIFGVVMLADTPILRNENKLLDLPVHYVTFSKDIIKEIVEKYSKNNLNSSVTLAHKFVTEGVYMFESYIINREQGIYPPKNFEDIKDGSWVARFKVENDDVWQSVKNGTFKGFSIEGEFKYNLDKDDKLNDEQYLKEIYEYLKKII